MAAKKKKAPPAEPVVEPKKIGRPTVLTGDWKALADAVGGVSALAEACSVSRTTVERWASGAFAPHRAIQLEVGQLAAQHGLTPPPFAK